MYARSSADPVDVSATERPDLGAPADDHWKPKWTTLGDCRILVRGLSRHRL